MHLPYRGCHAVLCGQSCSAVCVFQLLEEACLHFAEVSLGSRQTSGRQIYRSLVWGMSSRHVRQGWVTLVTSSLCGPEVSC